MPVTGPHPGHGHRPAIHSYDLHGIVRVASAVPLGDLQRFEVDECRAQPDLRLVIGRPARGEPRLGTLHGHPGATIAFSGVRVTAWIRRPQAWAPSLLYPSVVEPLLQRLFFDRGHALVHAACVSRAGRGSLILAGPGGGKTSLALSLARDGACFLGDDMILLSGTGRALAFPKHVKLPAEDGHLPRRGLLGGPAAWIRRQVHSRAVGAGTALRRLRLPTAYLNALVQALVPAPRFDCAVIAPGIELVDSAELARVLVIDASFDADTAALRAAVARRMARSTELALRGLLWNEVALAHAPRAGDLAPRVERLLPRRFELKPVSRRR